MNTSMTVRILKLPRFAKRALAMCADITICLATVFLAYWIRLDEWITPVGAQWLSYAAAILFAIPIFVSFGLYKAIFRYVGWGALMSVVRACAMYGLIYASAISFVGIAGVPRTIGVLQPILLFLAIGALRAAARYWLGGGYLTLMRLGQRRRVLIYGAGSAGRQLAAALANSDEMQVIGFVDDDTTLQGSVLNGKRIYPPGGLTHLIERLNIADMLLALPSASRQRRNQIIESVRGTPATIRTLPGLTDLAKGRVTVNDLRELDIEDLLGRDTVPPNHLLLSRNIAGRTVLVTGAGGSIGSELCRQILAMGPIRLLLVEQCEFNLYTIDQELERRAAGSTDGERSIIPLIASVQDEQRMRNIFSAWKPDTVYHAAAYKHVPLVEHNPAEGVRNNVLGTLTLANVAQECGVKDFVLISTDKAVRPTNVMGATKRIAELILQALAAESSSTRFSMVRFGNVLGSSGSVVPLFRKQIKAGGPVTITHEEITRYFMTIPEAAQLVIQAGAMATGGEVFVLDMGDPVKVIELARRMIELSGLSLRNKENPNGDIAIEIVGLRPGEKLYEELLIGDNPATTNHPRIMRAKDPYIPWSTLAAGLDRLAAKIDAVGSPEIIELVRSFVPEFENAPLLSAAATRTPPHSVSSMRMAP